MNQEEKVLVIKNVNVGMSLLAANRFVGQLARAVVPPPQGIPNRVIASFGRIVLTAMVAERMSSYVNKAIDSTVDSFTSIKEEKGS